MKKSAKGYSITELLVVIAMIGLISLVAVPAFMSMRNSAKIKAAVTTFANKVRSAQQLAVTSNTMTKIRFRPGTGRYSLWQQTVDPTTYQTTWTKVGSTWTLEGAGNSGTAETIYFDPDTNFSTDSVSWNSIYFYSNGTLQTPSPAPASGQSPYLWIKTTDNVSKNAYQVQISYNGAIHTP